MSDDPFLEQVAEAARLVGEQPLGVPRLQVLAEQQHCGVRVAVPDAPSRDQPFVGVRRRHPDVDEGDIRPLERHRSHQFVRVAALRNDLDAGIGEQPGQARPHQHDVVGDYDPHGTTAVSRTSPSQPSTS